MWKQLTLIGACLLALSLTDSSRNAGVNVWKKVSTDELNPGEIVPLDMSKGYAFADPMYIYIVTQIVDSDEEVVVVFPNGGHWTSAEPDPFLQELQEEFDDLEGYLRKLESKEIKKK